MAVFNWFCSGQLSNDEPLPDYFLLFAPGLSPAPLIWQHGLTEHPATGH